MDIEEKKVNVAFLDAQGTPSCIGVAHLFVHRYAGRTFWYGVAQVNDMPIGLVMGFGENPVAMKFDGGKGGHANIIVGKIEGGGYCELTFVGLESLLDTGPRVEVPASEL